MLYPFSRLCRPARSPASCSPALLKKKGFNLIESAVVLGVVGLVIGGIWVAASAVNEQWKATRHVQQIELIANRTMDLLKGQSYSIGTDTAITLDLYAAGVFPEDMPVIGGYPRNPWGGTIGVKLQAGSPVTKLELVTGELDYVACTKIVFGVGGTFRDKNYLTGMYTSKMDNSNGVSLSVPLTISPNNNTACNKDANTKVFFILNFPLS